MIELRQAQEDLNKVEKQMLGLNHQVETGALNNDLEEIGAGVKYLRKDAKGQQQAVKQGDPYNSLHSRQMSRSQFKQKQQQQSIISPLNRLLEPIISSQPSIHDKENIPSINGAKTRPQSGTLRKSLIGSRLSSSIMSKTRDRITIHQHDAASSIMITNPPTKMTRPQSGYQRPSSYIEEERSIAPVKQFNDRSTIMSPTATGMTKRNKDSIGEFPIANRTRTRPMTAGASGRPKLQQINDIFSVHSKKRNNVYGNIPMQESYKGNLSK